MKLDETIKCNIGIRHRKISKDEMHVFKIEGEIKRKQIVLM